MRISSGVNTPVSLAMRSREGTSSGWGGSIIVEVLGGGNTRDLCRSTFHFGCAGVGRQQRTRRNRIHTIAASAARSEFVTDDARARQPFHPVAPRIVSYELRAR